MVLSMTHEKHAVARELLAPVPDIVHEVLQRLEAAGGVAWLVGGTARDLLRRVTPTDWDVATTLPPQTTGGLFAGAEMRDAALGTCLLKPPDLIGDIVITSLREESTYSDHRHPDHVTFIQDPRVDARRRDFTCNALYLAVGEASVLDPTDGLPDLEDRRIRVIGDPVARLAEDPLRLLRGLRFAALLDGDLAPETAAAFSRVADGLRLVAAERVYSELTRTFTGPNRGWALRRGVELGLLHVVLPEVPPMDGVAQPPQYHPEGDVLTHVCMVLDRVPAHDPVLSWSAVLHDVGKPPTFVEAADRIRFDGHDQLSAEMADAVLRRLRAPKELRETVVEVCRDHIRIAALPQMRPSRRERWMRSPRFPVHLQFHHADCLGSHGDLSIYETAKRQLAELPPERVTLLRGSDVTAAGVPQGPLVGQLLRAVERTLDALQPSARTRDRALSLLDAEIAARVKDGG